MNSRTDIAELVVDYSGGPAALNGEVARMIETIFKPMLGRLLGNGNSQPTRLIADNPADVAGKLASILFNHSRSAATGVSDAKTLAGLRDRLLEFVRRGGAVEVQMLWSPKKHWVFESDSAVDLAELLAVQTLVSIDSAVRSVYPAGLSFVIDFEDVEFQFMEGPGAEVINAQDLYISGLHRIVEALELDELFVLRRISEHARDAEELRRWRQQMAENYRALEAYWHESEACPVSSWETLPSFNRIRELGWKGTIPPEMRRYYLGLLGKPVDTSDREKVTMVLRNLATILLHYQAGLLRGSGKIQPIKFSLVRSAAGAPASLQEGRVDIRFAPRKLCSRVSAAAPWSTKGFVCGRKNDMQVAFRGWRELADARHRFAEGWLTFGRHDVSACVRADFRLDDKR